MPSVSVWYQCAGERRCLLGRWQIYVLVESKSVFSRVFQSLLGRLWCICGVGELFMCKDSSEAVSVSEVRDED